MTAATITTLEALRDALNGVPQVRHYNDSETWREAVSEYALVNGLPWFFGSIVYDELPTFGGDIPPRVIRIWSWDSDNLLVHDGGRWRIVPRGESEGGAS